MSENIDLEVLEADDNLFAGNVPIQEALSRLRLRLLDLTGRNRLLNFKHSVGKSLRFVQSSPEAVFNRLVNGNNGARVLITPIAEPDRSAWQEKNGRLSKPEAKEYAASIGIDTSFELALTDTRLPVGVNSGNQVRALYYVEDMAKHCRKIEREARLAIEETGANMLYLVFGFLEYPDTKDSDKLFQAPLICVPVRIEKIEAGKHAGFQLLYTGEEVADNLSLREKLNRDYGLILPVFEEDEVSLEDYLALVEDAIAKMPRWRVRRMLSLTLLSFTNMLLVRDLDPEKWPEKDGVSVLLKHPIVRRVFEGSPIEHGSARYSTEYAVDEHSLANLPLIYDADSSQHSALIDVHERKNLVIEGPPGTGKSQTITNLIASALFAGKKVLFVAEKLAALEVVKARLERAGLEHFILELHSNKTNKKKVLEEIAKRVLFEPKVPQGLSDKIKTIEIKRKELKAYADLLNRVVGNEQELTVHDILWRAERYRQLISDSCVDSSREIIVDSAPSISAARYTELIDLLRYVAKQYDEIGAFNVSHPFWGLFPEELQPGDDLHIERALAEYTPKFEAFIQVMSRAVDLLGEEELGLSSEATEDLLNTLISIAPIDAGEISFGMLPKLFNQTDPDGSASRSTLQQVRSRLEDIARLKTQIGKDWISDEAASESLFRACTDFAALSNSLGLGGISVDELREKTRKLETATAEAELAVDSIHSFFKELGDEFDGSPSSLDKFKVIAEVAVTAPFDFLHLRHEDLRHSQALTVLIQAKEDLSGITERHAILDAQFYLDAMPAVPALRDAIRVLREGDAWYRGFQSRWRKAARVHRQLERTKSKKKGNERLADLEKLQLHSQRRSEWGRREDLRRFAGQHFREEDTPLDSLLQVSSWVVSSNKQIEAARVSTGSFDPITVEPNRLKSLQSVQPMLAQACEALRFFDELFKDEFQSANVGILATFSRGSWPQRIEQSQQLITGLNQICTQIGATVASGVSITDAIQCIQASHRLPQAEASLNSNAAIKELLGDHFQGVATRLEPIEAAHTYGRLVRSVKLPAAIESFLLTSESSESYAKLNELMAEIKQGWENVDEFIQRLSVFGEFSITKWAGSEGWGRDFLSKLIEKTHRATAGMEQLLPWAQYVSQREDSRRKGLAPFIALLENGEVPVGYLVNTYAYRFYSSIAQSIFRNNPALSRFSGTRHTTVRAEFADLDRQIIELRGQQIAVQSNSKANPPDGVGGVRVGDKTEMELLMLLMPQQRPRVSVRKMLKRAGKAIQELKPCFMMGPQAVAQFLEPGQLEFDIVVMDEASQLKPEQAIGAIARGKQLVVVGDPKQLPPTSFFARMNAAEDDEASASQQVVTDGAESILDVCMGHFQPVRSLRWHYRSLHESLIAFSNHKFYGNKLYVFPSPYPKGKALGLRYTYVSNGVYEGQMNKLEATRVVDTVIDHIQSQPEHSLGIVTLNIKQRDLIAELLEEKLKNYPEADEYRKRWDAQGMGLFIKNLENVQGDERDCIVISTTFGKAPGTNVVRQNFGPISREGGWRRLNVLFTRARNAVSVISSMQPEDIVVDGSTPEGTQALRDYLEYARSGVLTQQSFTNQEPDSDFEVAVIQLLNDRGFQVTPQLGVAGFRMDIAVKHPDYPSGYLAAIECDGATYHSGVSVRDRDRIRQEILESLGWRDRIWRIWSTDWFRNPRAEAEKLFSFLDALRAQPVPPEFVVMDELETIPVMSETMTAVSEVAADIELLDEEDDDLEIEVGDLVTYEEEGTKEPTVVTVRITGRNNDFNQGLIAEHTPLAQILLGATVGETVVLRVPGQPAKSFLIKEIKRVREVVNE